VEVDDAVGKAALVEQLEREADAVRRWRLPPPTTIGCRKRWR
jgi:hypothetical protein